MYGTVILAEDSHMDARPRDVIDVASKSEWSIQRLRACATAFAKQNQTAAVVLASAGGLIFGEAGRFLYYRSPIAA